MSKPTLGQMVEIVKSHGHYVWIYQGEEPFFVPCEEVVDRFGDVEVKDFGSIASPIMSKKPCNEFKIMDALYI